MLCFTSDRGRICSANHLDTIVVNTSTYKYLLLTGYAAANRQNDEAFRDKASHKKAGIRNTSKMILVAINCWITIIVLSDGLY